jgi:hypothetical protein
MDAAQPRSDAIEPGRGTQPLERTSQTISHDVPFRWPPKKEKRGLVRGQATGTL